MTENRLTENADYLLCALYSAYLERIKDGESSGDAKLFGESEYIQAKYTPELSTLDIDEAARELHSSGMLKCLFGDDELCQCGILPNGIIYMEHRFGDKLDSLAQRIAAIRSAFIS